MSKESIKIDKVYYIKYCDREYVVDTADVTRVTVKDSLVTIRIKDGYHGSMAYGYKGNNIFAARWGEYYSSKAEAERICKQMNDADDYIDLRFHCERLKSYSKDLGVNITIGGVE